MFKASTLTAIACLGLFAAGPALAGSCGASSVAEHSHDRGSLVDVADDAGQFSTLITAASAAGLAETLADDGPFTVFAPTDQAFASLPDGTLDHLLKHPEQLREILLFHVVPGKVKAKHALKAGAAQTAYGQPVRIFADKGQAFVNDAKILKTDIMADNGVIHVIDSVILPKDIVGVATSDGRFNTLVAAVKAAGLVKTLQGEGPFTVFAPTDDAFAVLPDGTVDSLLKPENKARLVDILTYHVAPGAVSSQKVVKLDQVDTVQGRSLNVKVHKDGDRTVVRIGGAQVLITDIRATNGVIHVIDSVLVPAESAAMAE